MTTETWRVVTEGGAIGSLEARAEAGGWHDVGGRQYHPLTPLRAAIAHAAWERDWAVVEILAPGELTRAEALADAQRAATLAETERDTLRGLVDGMREESERLRADIAARDAVADEVMAHFMGTKGAGTR